MKLSLYFKRYKKDTKGINPSNNPYVFENMFRGNPYIKEVSNPHTKVQQFIVIMQFRIR